MSIHGRPNDERGIIHNTILDIASTVIPIPGVSEVIEFGRTLLGGGSGGGRNGGRGGTESSVIPGISNESLGFRALHLIHGHPRGHPGQSRAKANLAAGITSLGQVRGGCEDPDLVMDPDGVCRFPGSPSGGIGELRKGRFGPAEEPFFVTRNVRFCLDGFILGKDKLCYKKGSISNKERLWPKGTPPLLTGGQMAAIRKADSAKKRVAATAKKLGLMKPATRRAPARHQHAVAAKGVVNV